MTSSLEVDDLVSGWNRTVVLNGLSLTATPGSTLAILGRNGAGKTTLFATLMGLTTLHDGVIRMGGRAIDALPTQRRARLGLGYVSRRRQLSRRATRETIHDLKAEARLSGHTQREIPAPRRRIAPYL